MSAPHNNINCPKLRDCDVKGSFYFSGGAICKSKRTRFSTLHTFQVLIRSQKLGEDWIAKGRKRWMLEKGCAEEYRRVNHRLFRYLSSGSNDLKKRRLSLQRERETGRRLPRPAVPQRAVQLPEEEGEDRSRNPVLDSKDIKAALGSIVAQMMDAYSYII